MRIGLLQAGHAPDELRGQLGDFSDLFEQLLSGQGFRFQTYNVVDDEFPASPNDQDGWLITGSRHGAYEDLPFIPPLEAFIREIYAAGLPLIGVCFGHQIIAQALGGKVEKFSGGWAVGRQTYETPNGEITLNAWHQDQVVERPEGARVIASNAFCENAALVYGDQVLTVQAHPEFDHRMVKGLAEARGRGVVPEPLLDSALAQLGEHVDQQIFAAQFAQFFKTRKAPS